MTALDRYLASMRCKRCAGKGCKRCGDGSSAKFKRLMRAAAPGLSRAYAQRFR